MSSANCKAITKSGEKCKLKGNSSGYCHIHDPEKIAESEAKQHLPEIEDLKRDRFLIRYWEIRSDRLWQSTRLSPIHSVIASKNKDSDRLSEKLKILINATPS